MSASCPLTSASVSLVTPGRIWTERTFAVGEASSLGPAVKKFTRVVVSVPQCAAVITKRGAIRVAVHAPTIGGLDPGIGVCTNAARSSFHASALWAVGPLIASDPGL